MKIVHAQDLARLRGQSETADRRRAHLNIHPELSDPVQRLIIALQPGTYVRPHRHNPGIWELFVLLEGACDVLTFDEDGALTQRVELRPHGARVAEIPVGTWHTILAQAPDSALFEVKPGPYSPITDKNFAAWAPAEGQPGVERMLGWFEGAQVGQKAQ